MLLVFNILDINKLYWTESWLSTGNLTCLAILTLCWWRGWQWFHQAAFFASLYQGQAHPWTGYIGWGVCKDSTLIMQHFPDYLTVWTSDKTDETGDKIKEYSNPSDELQHYWSARIVLCTCHIVFNTDFQVARIWKYPVWISVHDWCFWFGSFSEVKTHIPWLELFSTFFIYLQFYNVS